MKINYIEVTTLEPHFTFTKNELLDLLGNAYDYGSHCGDNNWKKYAEEKVRNMMADAASREENE